MIYIAYDLPTQLGYDPDSPQAQGEVGRVGVSLTTQKDWEIAFDGIDLGKVRISQVPNAVAAFQIGNHICLAEGRGLPLSSMRGFCQNDILKEYIVRGNYIYPPGPSLRLAVDAVAYCAQYAPQYRAMSVTGSHFSESQATPVHDAAFMLADAFCYIEAALERGLDVDTIASGIEFSTGIEHYSFFEEIAKHRAIRRIYGRTLKDRFKAKRPESMIARIGSSQGGNSLHREQYLNNIARSAICGVVAALSGVERLSLRAYDEQYGIPTTEAMVASTRVMHVVTQETGITDTVDPLAGSYFVEWLTSEFEERITRELEEIEAQGGVIRCIENGYIKRKIIEDAYQWQKEFEAGKVVRVGANFARSEGEEERPVRVYRADPKVEEERIEAVRELKKRRDNGKVRRALDEVKATALLPGTVENNLMPSIIEAVRCYATNGEIAGVLREAWGEYEEPRIL
jgi:methylmalonyl-CoA mutase N-terminal domain/subunit